MIYLLVIIWYLIGSIGGLLLSYLIIPKITNGDLFFIFSIGGIGGLLTLIIGLTYLPKGSTKRLSGFLDWLLIKLIRRRWGKLYKRAQNNQIGTPEYSKKRRSLERLIMDVELDELFETKRTLEEKIENFFDGEKI